MKFRVLILLAVALCAGCASKQPAPQAVAPTPEPPPPMKAPEATLAQRAAIRTDLAAGYYERGQFEVALTELAEAQRLDASYPRIYNVYGLVYSMMGEDAKAEENFRKAVSMAPNDSEIRHNWGAF